ncbi:glycerophosphodiester phosphodiesterase family protein [Xanthomonas albilineans]|uniref:glycerophosphodiester phosphodiesterase family protein n=2 Tax=Xanthomonas albilineans TaxID=29447 RepID=UPI001E2AD9F0|nr:glycerophosphodiester phosphodiesterase family protein [Xanthomonas albilineans]
MTHEQLRRRCACFTSFHQPMNGRESMKLQRKFLKTLSLALVCAALSGVASAANNWNPQHILNTMKDPYIGNTVNVAVISHRGMIGRGCPENSVCSIINTYRHDVEAIELDIKQAADGQLWLFHDQNAGRVIDHNPNFNIFQPPTNPAGWDPDIRTMTTADLDNSFLRDRFFVRTRYRPATLAVALNTVYSNANHMVVVLDLKTLDAVSRAADIVLNYRMENQVVLKFSASLLAKNPDDIKLYTKGVPFAPTIYAPDMDKLADNYNGLCGGLGTPDTPLCRVEAWITEARNSNVGFAWLEIGNKQPRRGDPTAEMLADQQSLKRALGAFSPVPEYRFRNHDGRHYVRSNGTCCASLNDYLSTTKYFGNEIADDRPNFRAQAAAGFTSIITDDPLSVINSDVHRYPSLYD